MRAQFFSNACFNCSVNRSRENSGNGLHYYLEGEARLGVVWTIKLLFWNNIWYHKPCRGTFFPHVESKCNHRKWNTTQFQRNIKKYTTCNKRIWLQFIVRYMELSAVVCHFAVQERFLISKNLRLRDLPITVTVHFLKKVKCLLTWE